MLKASPILKTKLVTPRVQDIINRESVSPLFSQIKLKKLTTITAGAGYGKTTFIAQAIHNLDLKAVWYRLNKSDEDFITFLRYLSAGIKKIYPDYGNGILSILGEPHGLKRDHKSLLTFFINEFESLPKENLYLVLDDFHTICDSQEINNALMFLLNNLPNHIHLIFISRKSIDLPLSRLRAMREVIDVTSKELAFNPSEIKQLFIEIFDLPLEENHITLISEKTGGWVSGLILLFHMLKGKVEKEKENLLSNLKGSMGEFYRYLDENIFQTLIPYEKEFLLKTSILSKLTPDLCNELLNITDSGEILKKLKTNHLFTFSLEEAKEGYIYHDLFKDYLYSKLEAEIDKKEFCKIHETAARLHEKKMEYRLALYHYLRAECMEDVSRLTGMFARSWIKQGSVQLIRLILEQIPELYLQKDPWMLYLQAGLMELSGQLEKASITYGRALESFRSRSSTAGLNTCLIDLAITYLGLGNYKKAEPLLKELLISGNLGPVLKIICLGYLISLSYDLGKTKESDHYTKEALSMLPKIADEADKNSLSGWIYSSIARKYLLAGKLNDALEKTEQALKFIKHTQGHRLIISCYQMLSEIYYKSGHFDEGIAAATKLIGINEEKGFKDGLLPAGLIFLSYNSLCLGRHKEALEYGKKSLMIAREMGRYRGQVEAHILLHFVYSDSGDLKAAEESVRQGMKIARYAFPFDRNMLDICQSSVMVEKGKCDQALKLLKNVEKAAQHLGWLQARVFIGYARCFQKDKQNERAIKALSKALSFCESNGYDVLLIMQKQWIIPLLVELYALGEKKDYIQNILSRIGSNAITDLAEIIKKHRPGPIKSAPIQLFNILRQESSPGLNIHFFGKFRVFIGEEELHLEKWTSKKAINLLKYLAFSRERGFLNKEILMELLWPDEDPEKSANRLHVVLAFLRKALEPQLAKGISSAYILSNGGGYKLNIGKQGWIDLEEFSLELKQAKAINNPEKSFAHYMRAISLYNGNFLADDPYNDWCGEIREKYKEDYLHALSVIIEYYENRKEFKKCINYAEKYLKTDKYAEEIYQTLMRCHSFLGCNAGVIKTFNKCRENIEKELNCPLNRKTLELSNQLGLN